jgi:hypothetical protein
MLLAYYWARPVPVPKVANYVQLTHDGQPKALVGTDGSRLYLGFARTITYNATIGIMQMSTSGGDPIRIPAIGPWLGLGPDDSPLLLKDTGHRISTPSTGKRPEEHPGETRAT